MNNRISNDLVVEIPSILHKNDSVKDHIKSKFYLDRQDLKKWANINPDKKHWTGFDAYSDWFTFHDKLGGAEAISLKIQNTLLDKDHNGQISEEEIKNGEEIRKNTVDQALSLLTTAGVVGALLASIITPLVYSPLIISDLSEEYFHPSTVEAFSVLYRIFISFSLVLSFVLIWQSTRKFLQLSFWMPNLDMKSWYLSEVSMLPIIITQMWTIIFAVLAAPFGVAILVSPSSGLILLIAIGLCISLIQWENRFGKGNVFIVKAMHNFTRTVVFNMKNSDSKD